MDLGLVILDFGFLRKFEFFVREFGNFGAALKFVFVDLAIYMVRAPTPPAPAPSKPLVAQRVGRIHTSWGPLG